MTEPDHTTALTPADHRPDLNLVDTEPPITADDPATLLQIRIRRVVDINLRTPARELAAIAVLSATCTLALAAVIAAPHAWPAILTTCVIMAIPCYTLVLRSRR